jgi:hypothetical protein
MEPTDNCENGPHAAQNLKVALGPEPWSMFTRVAVSGMFVLAVLYTLYFAKPVLLPIVLAMLMAWVMRRLVRSLEALHLPRSLAAAAVVGGLVATLAGGAYYLPARPRNGWKARHRCCGRWNARRAP